jgi:hypothetical protein
MLEGGAGPRNPRILRVVHKRTIKAIGGNPLDRLRLLIRNHVISPDVPRIRLFESEFHHLSADRHARIHNMRRTYLRYVVDLIEEAQASQLCSPDVKAQPRR